MTTEIKYQLFRVTGPDKGYQIGELFNTEMVAKNYALNIKDSEAQQYKIRSVVTTTSTLDVFTVPAHVPTLEEIANEIIAGSDGSFYMEWGDHFERLEEPARSQVEDMVNEAITSCDGCGWHWHVESMEHFDDSGETLCYKCADDRYNEEEEDEDDED
jgi:hypothetical protein